ncbi:fructosamine kinase family protein [Salinisphaera hydrothermalis]|uniref:Fructosamine kinase n=1 Tax=Salinisphaera hydrothermalis (strain C41B8) TaxID=1304275 RepID=A0A084IJ90_SALHC|nr:fructosamine kinase family protein [Salinisphaera hydrothermalis]KEZ76774.1 fructosamine kinase [Salinisphaera hydrothermalis C41B8]
MSDWAAIEHAISAATGRAFSIDDRRAALGGDINEAHILGDGERRFFVKTNRPERRDMFEAEAAGLVELRQATLLRVPEPITVDATGELAFIVLEYVPLARPTRESMTRLGEGLAELHGIVATRHGWDRDNTLGPNPQHNARHADWTEFWRENRLAVMLDALAPDYPDVARDGDRLLAVLPDLLSGHKPEASLLHGDLWGGNAGMDEDGRPVIYDPAVYYGDRETDLALTELFGGFSPDFYEAYWGAWPAAAGYREIRRPLYQLHHLLNHARLFGGGYAAQARRVMNQLIARA